MKYLCFLVKRISFASLSRVYLVNSISIYSEYLHKFLHKKGLLVAKALVCPETGTVPVRIANPYDQKLELNKHTIVATFEPLEPEELLSVNTTKTVSNSDSTYSETDIPEHSKTYILIVLSICLSITNPNLSNC